MRRRSAFTLVELLVVIAIISMLVAILLPSLAAAREKARQAKCLANLKSIGMGFSMYAEDNSGFLPPQTREDNTVDGRSTGNGGTYLPGYSTSSIVYWCQRITPYLKNNVDVIGSPTQLADISPVLRSCPDWNGAKDTGVDKTPLKASYGMVTYPFLPDQLNVPAVSPSNRDIWSDFANSGALGIQYQWTRFIKLNEITLTDRRFLVGDSVDYHINAAENFDSYYTSTCYGFASWSGSTPNNVFRFRSGHPDRHGDRAGYLFYDMHAEMVPASVARFGVANPKKLQQ